MGQGVLQGGEGVAIGDIHLGDAVAAPGKGDKSQIGGARPHLAEEKSPFAQLVETAALDAAAIGIRDRPGGQNAAAAVNMTQRQIVQPAARDIRRADRTVAAVGGRNVAMEQTNVDKAVLRYTEAGEYTVRGTLRGG